MKKVIYTAAAGVFVFGLSSQTFATELIYGFNDPTINGFTLTYDGSGNDGTDGNPVTAPSGMLSESTGTGVTEGVGALDLHSGQADGYTQSDFGPAVSAPDLFNNATTSISATAETYYADANYITIQPVFQLNGTIPDTTGGTNTGVFHNFENANGLTITGSGAAIPGTTPPYTLTFATTFTDPYATAHTAGSGNAATNADGDVVGTKYTPGQILSAFLAANPTATASYSFFFQTTTSGTAAGVDLYLDDVTVPLTAVPEPASMGILVGTGAFFLKRRSR